MATPEITLEWLQARVREDEDGCWIWTLYINEDGEPRARVAGKSVAARRVLWRSIHDREPGELQVAVRCKKPGCMHPNCLLARSKSAALTGRKHSLTHRMRIAKATRTRSYALPEEEVRAVRASKLSGVEEAKRLGKSASSINNIRRGEAWRDYTNNPFAGLGG